MFGVAEVAALRVWPDPVARDAELSLFRACTFARRFTRSRPQANANEPVKHFRASSLKIRNTKETVQKITTSLDKFETDFLLRQDQGRMELYDELNQLIIKNRVRNTSGPMRTELDPEGTKQNRRQEHCNEVAEFLSGRGGDGYGRRAVRERSAFHSRR